MSRKPGAENRRQTLRARAVKLWQVHQRVARTSAHYLLAQPGSSLLTVFVVAVSLLLPSLLFQLHANLNQLLVGFQQDTRLTVYFADAVTDAEARIVSEDLLLRDDVQAVDFVSSDEGLAEFSRASGLGEVLSELSSNPLPAAVLVTPATADAAALETLATTLELRPDVALVQVDRQWMQRLAAISQLIRAISTGLSAIVVLGLLVIVGNTIKLAIENRRQEIRVIKLVGGTDAFIARPLLYAGLYYGAAGGVVAVLLQFIVLLAINGSLDRLLALYDSNFVLQSLTAGGVLKLIIAGAVIGWAAALIASLRHIRSVGNL